MHSGLAPTKAAPSAGAAAGGEPDSAFSFARLASTSRLGWQAFVAELSQLFRVSRVDAPDVVLLAPEQQYFVRENLRLTLLSARLALLARSEPLFRADLKRAIDWLNVYYDTRQRSVVNAIAALRQLQDTRIAAELPSLGDTLAAVRAARDARERN
jgi:uroporphyrin-3 C-methyltransferase